MATLLKHDRTRRKSSQPSKLLANGLAKTALISTSGRAATNRVHLVDGEIDRLAAPESGTRSYYHDDAVHGLTVAVSRGGKRLFVLYRHLDGKPERITLGVCSEMTVKQARIAAMKMIADAASGKNAADERRALRDEATLDDLFKTLSVPVSFMPRCRRKWTTASRQILWLRNYLKRSWDIFSSGPMPIRLLGAVPFFILGRGNVSKINFFTGRVWPSQPIQKTGLSAVCRTLSLPSITSCDLSG